MTIIERMVWFAWRVLHADCRHPVEQLKCDSVGDLRCWCCLRDMT